MDRLTAKVFHLVWVTITLCQRMTKRFGKVGVGSWLFFFVDFLFFDVFSLKNWWKQLVPQGTCSLGLIEEPQTGNFDAAVDITQLFFRWFFTATIYSLKRSIWDDCRGVEQFPSPEICYKKRCDTKLDGWAVHENFGWLDLLSRLECLFRGR